MTTNHLPDYMVSLGDGQAVFQRRNEARRLETPIVLSNNSTGPDAKVRVSSQALEQLKDVAPGWDRYALEAMYLSWIRGKDRARNEDARFLAWAKSFTKGRAP